MSENFETGCTEEGLYYVVSFTMFPGSLVVGATENEVLTRAERAAQWNSGETKILPIGHVICMDPKFGKILMPNPEMLTEKQRNEVVEIVSKPPFITTH